MPGILNLTPARPNFQTTVRFLIRHIGRDALPYRFAVGVPLQKQSVRGQHGRTVQHCALPFSVSAKYTSARMAVDGDFLYRTRRPQIKPYQAYATADKCNKTDKTFKERDGFKVV